MYIRVFKKIQYNILINSHNTKKELSLKKKNSVQQIKFLLKILYQLVQKHTSRLAT